MGIIATRPRWRFATRIAGLKDAEKVMMTFVNMHSPGLEILATHRVLSGHRPADLANKIQARRLDSIDELKRIFRTPRRTRFASDWRSRAGQVCICMSAIANPANWT